MDIEYDPAKSALDVQRRGLPFSLVENFGWESAIIRKDDRIDYGEDRFVAIGPIDQLVYAVVFTPRGRTARIISLRRANRGEVRSYERSVSDR